MNKEEKIQEVQDMIDTLLAYIDMEYPKHTLIRLNDIINIIDSANSEKRCCKKCACFINPPSEEKEYCSFWKIKITNLEGWNPEENSCNKYLDSEKLTYFDQA